MASPGCFWGGALDVISAAGHDAVWAGAWEPDPADTAILAFANREGRTDSNRDEPET